jgi:serine/threonine-protein kinase
MEIYCTRPGCARPVNHFADLDDSSTLKTAQQKYCMTCGMPLILLGRYLPTRLLGQGGFGAAFLARDRYTPAMRQCVVKLFQPSGDLSPAQLQLAQDLFEREGQVLELLGNRHPQIPDLLAFFEQEVPGGSTGKTERFFYLVQEFIDGQDLEEEMEQRGAFSSTEVIEVLVQILKVLQFVHDNGSIHRDIKPSNIMRHRDGRLYLLDFGAVKQVTAGAASAGSAKGSTGIYSMGFAPPEQMSGGVVYPATDLYALAVTCITLLTGKQPNELYEAYQNKWNWRHYATVNNAIADVLDRMLLPTPSQRFQSANEVLAALKAAISSTSPQPPPSVSTPQPSPLPTPASAKSASATVSQPPAQQPPLARVTPPPQNPVPRSQQQPPKRSFSLMEVIGGAAFTGVESGVLGIALISVLGTTLISSGFWLALVGILVFAQNRRWIERFDLVIIAAVTLALVLIISPLRTLPFALGLGSLEDVIFLIILAGLLSVAVALIFQLIYRILSRLF